MRKLIEKFPIEFLLILGAVAVFKTFLLIYNVAGYYEFNRTFFER